MKTSTKRTAVWVFAIILSLALPVTAQDTSVQAVMYRQRQSGLWKDQAGGVVVMNQRFRKTVAQINTGATLLPALTGYKYRMIDAAMIAYGGAVGTCTTVDILGTQATASVKLLASAIASLTQSALLRAGASNATILSNGASFDQNDVSTAVTVGKTGGSCDTATGVDIILTYAIEQ
jgi:hypothetical protein